MHRSLTTHFLAALVLFVPAATGQNDKFGESYGSFMLFNDCRPMKLVIEYWSDDATAIDLTKDALQATVESRLRPAGLYVGSLLAVFRGETNIRRAGLTVNHLRNLGLLSVDVEVAGPEFSMSIEFSKILTDEFQNSSHATTWDWANNNRPHGGSASYIVSTLSLELDKFLADYLRVNEKACEAK